MAIQYASPRTPAGYLASLKPIVAMATTARSSWLRTVQTLAQAEDLAEFQAEAVQNAIRQRERINEARRMLNAMTAPEVYRDMERALNDWLEALVGSCDAIANATAGIQPSDVEGARKRLRGAAESALKFNSERSSVITVGAPRPAPVEGRPPGRPLSRRTVVIGLLVLLVLAIVLYVTLFSGGTSDAIRRTLTGQAGTVERRAFPQAEITARLKAEIASRNVLFQNLDIRLVAPDKIVVTGTIAIPNRPVPVEVQLTTGVTPNGRPRLTAGPIAAVGVQLPPEANEALARRVEEGNVELAKQIAPNQFVRRLAIEDGQLVADVETVGGTPVAASPTPAAAGGPPPKPAP